MIIKRQYAEMLKVCVRACERRVAEIDEAVKPEGPVQ